MPYELPIRVYIPEAIKFVKECPFFDEEYALNIPRYRILSVLDEPTEECQLDVSGIETFVKTRRFFPKFYKYYPPITIYDDLELVVSLIQLLLPEIENFWSPYIEAPFILRLLSAGFIPIATKLSFNDPNLDYIVLLPKFHIRRSCIIPPKAIHIPKKATKWARGLDLTIDAAFNQVIVGIVDQHGENWMYSAIRKELYKLNCYQRGIQLFNHTDLCIPDNTTYNKYNASIHSVEIWRGDTLIAGEIGCLVGKVWTSITAFHSERNSGMVQLLSLASLLTKIGVHIFDLGMCMDYKTAIGANTLEREDFFSVFRKYKTAEKGDLYTGRLSCVKLISNLKNEIKL
ncbi:Leu/Phe-tRNA protein transferase, putative [Babesia microti strain RI]|uniref:Leu/Phe-tRNA protein transferase, putative n=1 Tax=Babesia microti (strain RI) TaxID=1133968 RepID=A0A1R4ABB6_BABMR|nr:Leu/Phe-tRNA protein transferase, putative [Babesia microti strain RI]SJK86245.1 Leu/Phe-tRNA protein transferase, putative [Babesia microti strain RI]|eukprot:XP_021338427.1 Leu/Phe-tRNA protein transferase, putative [Babesia microti strain RI]